MDHIFSKNTGVEPFNKHYLGNGETNPVQFCLKKYMEYMNTSLYSEWPSSKSLSIINTREDVKKREPSYTGRNVSWWSRYGGQYGGSLKKSKARVAIWFRNGTPGHISRENYN